MDRSLAKLLNDDDMLLYSPLSGYIEIWNVCCLKGFVGACPVLANEAAQSASKGSEPNDCDLGGGARAVLWPSL